MIWIIAFGMCLGLAWLASEIFPNNSEGEGPWILPSIIAAILLIILCVSIPLTTFNTLKINANLARIEKDLPIVEKQYEAIVATIQTYARKYPIEEGLLRDLNPKILLKLPEIKSDTFLIEQINIAIEYQQRIYALQLEKNQIWAKAKVYSHRWFMPTLVKPNI
jgi:hypothetical protein